jgi:DHA2 family multidrug resistance protein-like MFS transporter
MMEHADGLPQPQRAWAVLAILLGLAMAVLDGAIANVALPSIAQDLRVDASSSIWVVNAYQLAVTVSLLPLASLAEIVGYRRVFSVGLAVFTAASLACAMSDTLLSLTLARVLQGLGGAGIMSVNTALVRFIYPRAQIGRGIGMNAMIGSFASAVGPTVASAILSLGSWQWLFAVNVPIGLLTLAVAIRALPQTERMAVKFDLPSAALNAVAFGLLITGIDELAHGQQVFLVAGELAGAVVFGIFLVVRQLSRPAPLLPVDLLRIPLLALSVATSVCSFAAQGLAYVALPFYMQDVLGRTQVQTGLLMTPWPLTVALIAPLSGRLVERMSAGLLGGLGLAVMAAGLLLMALLPAHPATLDIVWRMAICGLGFGFFNSPNNHAIMTSAPRARSGGASGLLATARLLGQTSGAALVALIFGLFPQHGTVTALLVATCFAGGAALVSFLRMTGLAGTPAE